MLFMFFIFARDRNRNVPCKVLKPESFLRFEKGGNNYSFSIMIHILLQITQHTSTIHLHDSIISYVI